MFPSKHLEGVGQSPWRRFVSTYSRDYIPFSEHHLQVNQQRLPLDAGAAASPIISPLPTGHDFWSTFYKTTNSEYGSPVCSQSGVHAAHVEGAVGSALTEARTPHTAVSGYSVHFPLLSVLVPQQAQDEPQGKVELLYEEGVIEISPVCPACYKGSGSACREAGLQYLLHLPVVSSPVATIKGVENVDDSAFLMGLTAFGLRSSAYLQPFPRQCSCCAWETELPYRSCFQMQTFPPCIHHGSTQPVASVQPSREPLLTEYQTSYAAQWDKSQIQQNSLHLPHHHLLHQSL